MTNKKKQATTTSEQARARSKQQNEKKARHKYIKLRTCTTKGNNRHIVALDDEELIISFSFLSVAIC